MCVQSGGLERDEKEKEERQRKFLSGRCYPSQLSKPTTTQPYGQCPGGVTGPRRVHRCRALVGVDLQPSRHGGRGLDVRADLVWSRDVCVC